MSWLWRRRLDALERMDTEPLDEQTARQVLKALETINVWLGGVRATLYHFQRFARHWPPAQTIHVVDWGTGGADIPRALVRWARREGHPIQIVGVDHNPTVVAYAEEACRDFPEIRIVNADAAAFHPADKSFDYAISSLTLHHLRDDQIVGLLRESDRVARRGIVMNDLQRSARAYAWIWLLSRLGRAHSMVQFDGPLSVRRAFTASELAGYAQRAGLSYLTVTKHFGYRMTLAGEKR